MSSKGLLAALASTPTLTLAEATYAVTLKQRSFSIKSKDTVPAFGLKDGANATVTIDKGKAGVAETYKACSGGESPNCCTCMETLRSMVRDHNHAIAVKTLSDSLPTKNPKEKA